MARRLLFPLVLLVVVLAANAPHAAQPTDDDDERSERVGRTDRLDAATIKMGLAVSEEENDGFVERVVCLMNRRRLSRASVTIAFAKAKKRVKHKFQYFKYAMIELADREGVRLK